MIHPDVIDALVAAGATAQMIAAAIRADFGASPSVTRDECDVTRDERDQDAQREANRLRQRRFRAKSKSRDVTRDERDTALSLKEIDLFPSERGEGKGSGGRKPETPGPMPDDWKPDPKTWAWAIAKLGEGAALRCLANYRDHAAANAKPMTEAQRQAKFRIWVRNERSRAAEPQPQLPLMTVVSSGPVRVFVTKGSPAWNAQVAAGHKPGLVSYSRERRADGWWFASEWPPGHGPPMRATG